MSATVQTVLGDVSPGALGRTLTHEHMAMDFWHFYKEPPQQLTDKLNQDRFTLENVGYIRQYPYSFKYNLILNDDASKTAVLNDLKEYKKFGGGTIVENTTVGLGREVNFMRSASQQTGVHVVAGTGFYIADTQTDSVLSYTQRQLYDHMLYELTQGCDDSPGVKAGFMGEIASVWPIRDFEKKAIKAAGELQEHLQCGVSFHPHRVPEAPFEVMRLYQEAGGRAHKAVMSHLDRTLLDEETLLEFANLGTYCQLDLFGVEVSLYQLNPASAMPSDAERLERARALLAAGHAHRLLLSHDVHTKHRLADFGGHGYSHIINNVLPRMKATGVSQEIIDKITIENPAEWLAFQK